MNWVQVACHKEIHGDGAAGDLLLRDARGDFSAWRGSVQCVYLDPPFLTGEQFFLQMRVGEKEWESGRGTLRLPAYSDQFSGKQAYLDLLRAALENARALLNDSGSLFLHLDSRMGALQF